MKRLAALAVLALAAVLASPANAAPRATCAKPRGLRTMFKQNDIVVLRDIGAAANTRMYLCRRGLRRPRKWYDTHAYGDLTQGERFALVGGRLGFAWEVEGEDDANGYV